MRSIRTPVVPTMSDSGRSMIITGPPVVAERHRVTPIQTSPALRQSMAGAVRPGSSGPPARFADVARHLNTLS
jgi:hypothetical protein